MSSRHNFLATQSLDDLHNTSRDEFFLELDSLQTIQREAAMWDLYTSNDTAKVSLLLGEGPVAARAAIDLVIDRTAKIVYDNYIASKINDHLLRRTFRLQELPQNMYYLQHDDIQTPIELDSEPLAVDCDNWRRSVADVERKDNPVLNFATLSDVSDNKGLSSKHGNARYLFAADEKKNTKSSWTSQAALQKIGSVRDLNKTRSTHGTAAKEAEYNPPLIDMGIVQEFDYEIETLRVLKDREGKMKMEKAALDAQREREMKEQQSRLRGALADQQNKKLFTYDFDGRILPMNGIKLDKLPQTVQQLPHHIYKENDLVPTGQQKNQKTNVVLNNTNGLLNADNSRRDQPVGRKSNALIVAANKQNGAIGTEARSRLSLVQTQLPPGPNMMSGQGYFEQFDVKQGVTLIAGTQIREGPRPLQNMDASNISSFIAAGITGGAAKLRLTKREYENLIRGGNLSREQLNHNQLQSVTDQQLLDIELHDEATDTFAVNDFTTHGGLLHPTVNDSISVFGNQSKSKRNLKKQQHSQSSASLLGHIKVENTREFARTLQTMVDDTDLYNSERYSLATGGKNKNSVHTLNSTLGNRNILHTTQSDANNSSLQNVIDDFNKNVVGTRAHDLTNKITQIGQQAPLSLPAINHNNSGGRARIEREQAQHSIGLQVVKHPRSRLTFQAEKALSFTHLPPPAYGKVIGHGVTSGFNPDNVGAENIESILENLHNNSSMAMHNTQQSKYN